MLPLPKTLPARTTGTGPDTAMFAGALRGVDGVLDRQGVRGELVAQDQSGTQQHAAGC